MDFRITSTRFYNKDLLEHYPVLKEFGYFEKTIPHTRYRKIFDEDGKQITQVYVEELKIPHIRLNSLEEFSTLTTKLDENIIWSIDSELEIYDGWRE